jgi:hypothetical protein
MPPEVLIFTSFRRQVAVVRQQVVAVVRQQVVAVVRQQVVAVVRQQVVAVVRQQVVAVQQAFAPLQAVPQAFSGKTLPTELCLPLQVAIAFSFYLPPKKFCYYYILILNRLSSFL